MSGRWFDDLGRDVRYAWRSLGGSPVFTTVSVLGLALGIGATTAIFSVVHGVLLKPLPYVDADRVVRARVTAPPATAASSSAPASGPSVSASLGSITVRELIELRSRIKGLSHVAFRGGPSFVTMSGVGETRRLQGMSVAPGAFDVLGVRPLLGRTFGASEEAPGAEHVMLLAHDTWQRQFNGDPAVVGRRVMLANALGGPAKPTTHTILGVMPRGFEFPDAQMQFWTPVPWTPPSSGSVIARLADDVSMPAAAAELEALLREIKGERRPAAFELTRAQDSIVQPVKPALLVLMLASGFVLLIACANVANLLLARTVVRQRELAIRTAIGAGRGRLVRQLLTESILLALLGGAAGTMLAIGGVRLLRGLGTTLNRMDLGVQLMFPRLGEVGVNGTVLAVTLGMALATGLLCGLAPALLHSADRQMDLLRVGATANVAGFGTRLRGGFATARARLRGVLVIAEVALAMILLIGGGLLLHSLVKLTSIEPGYRAAGVLTFQVALPATRYPSDRVRAFAEDLTTRLGAAPGVQAAAYAQQLPLVSLTENALFRRTPERPARFIPGSPELRLVSRDYLSVMGTRILQGRGLTEGDAAGRPRVLLINETAARRELPNQNPIGLQVHIGNDAGLWEIVGVVEDVRQFAFNREPTPQVFVDIRQWSGQVFPIGPYFSMRTQGGMAATLAAAYAAAHQIDAEAGLFNVAPMVQIVANSTSRPRLYATLLGLFAAIAAALAAIGIYGVIAYAVAQRTREIGIRMALGAPRAQVIGLMMRQSLVLTAAGVLIGIAAAAALARYLEGMLFGLTPLDPTTWAGVSVGFTAVAAVAAYVPARRAATIDPLRALRAE
jgi:predicted permease